MSNSRGDILSIEQYLRGQLDAHAMHLFERATLDNPFLMDAVDGYASRASQQANVDTIRQRLHQRVGNYTHEEQKPFNLRLLIIATITVIGFALVAAWWILVHIPQQKADMQKDAPKNYPHRSVISPSSADSLKKDSIHLSGHGAVDSLQKDSANKKKDSVDKRLSPAAAIKKDARSSSAPAEPVVVIRPAAQFPVGAKSAVAVGNTVHPSTVIADLNKWPYGSRKKALTGQSAPNDTIPASTGKTAPDKPQQSKPIIAGPTASKPQIKSSADKPLLTKQQTVAPVTKPPVKPAVIAAPVAKPTVILKQEETAVEKDKQPSQLEQLLQKNNPTTVIIPPKSDEVITTVSTQKSAAPATALSRVPSGIVPVDSATGLQKSSSLKVRAGDSLKNRSRINRVVPDDGMRGRDISSFNGATYVEKNSKAPVTSLIKNNDQPTRNVKPVAANPKKDTITKGAVVIRKKLEGPPILLNGRVVSILTGKPIAQIVMWNKTEDIQHRLEADGEFDIVAHKGDEIYVGRSGYKTQKVKVKNRKRFDIILEEQNSSLYDGYLQGLNFNPYDDTAHPSIGWDRLKVYQKIKTIDGKTGTIKVKFTVNKDDSLSDIKVEDSVSAAADTQAVKIVREQLKWIHNTNNRPETITLKFKVE